jgi:hypothetical protein
MDTVSFPVELNNDNQSWVFNCKTCDAHLLTVTRVWNVLAGPESEKWQEWGPLEADHISRFIFKEKIEETTEDETDLPDYRQKFKVYVTGDSVSRLKDYEIYQPRDNPGNDMFFVNCSGCDREIEFGWSLPNRGGLIYPAECSDFVPEELWPEPRYLDSWHEKHWLKRED